MLVSQYFPQNHMCKNEFDKTAPKRGVLAILGIPEMAFWVPKSKFEDHLSIQTSPQNPQNQTSKSDFWSFYQFGIFLRRFPIREASPFQNG